MEHSVVGVINVMKTQRFFRVCMKVGTVLDTK